MSPNLYSIFAVTFILIFMGHPNVIIFVFQVLAAACIPVAYHFIQDNYVLLNMLTYFPYVERKNYYFVLGNVVMVWVVFILSHSMLYVAVRQYKNNLSVVKMFN